MRSDGLSTGSVVLPLDASDATPSDGSPADQTSGSDVAVGVDAADGSAHAFPPEAQTWPGNGHGYALYLVPGGVTWDDARNDDIVTGNGERVVSYIVEYE
jgi:hypothetical protein